MNTYDRPIMSTHSLQAADLTSAAVLASIAGPAGRQGRIVGLSAAVTTGVTAAAATLAVGSPSDADAYATLTVPISAADSVANGALFLTDDDNLIPADSVVELSTGGEATAGAAGLTLIIAWF